MPVEVVLVLSVALCVLMAVPVLTASGVPGGPGRPAGHRVGLIAEMTDEPEAALAAVRDLGGADMAAALARAGIHRVQGFTRRIEGRTWLVIYFVYDGDRPVYEAAAAFEAATAGIDWGKRVRPHPRAATRGGLWMQMEWICWIAGREGNLPTTGTVMIGTTVRPEMEMTYRTLHQTVWPGVAEQIARGNHRDLSIFMVELGDQLVEFLYMEYVGHDPVADAEADRTDPVTLRWWKLTDACQKPFSDVTEGIWAPLTPVS